MFLKNGKRWVCGLSRRGGALGSRAIARRHAGTACLVRASVAWVDRDVRVRDVVMEGREGTESLRYARMGGSGWNGGLGDTRSLRFGRDDGGAGRDDETGMASPWSDAGVASNVLDERSLNDESARGALGDGGEAGRVALGHCPGMHLSADVPLATSIEHMFSSCKGRRCGRYSSESESYGGKRNCMSRSRRPP